MVFWWKYVSGKSLSDINSLLYLSIVSSFYLQFKLSENQLPLAVICFFYDTMILSLGKHKPDKLFYISCLGQTSLSQQLYITEKCIYIYIYIYTFLLYIVAVIKKSDQGNLYKRVYLAYVYQGLESQCHRRSILQPEEVDFLII